MRLLVSVASPDDVREAVAGGADIIDAKDPGMGALGAVPLARLSGIREAVGDARPLTAALGDAVDATSIGALAAAYAEAGASLVKIGLLGTSNGAQAVMLASAAVRGAAKAASGVVVVAYADAPHTLSLRAHDVIAVAAHAGAHGVLLDTLDKDGPGLVGVVSPSDLARWVSAARAAGLLVAVAGKLTAADLPLLRDLGADIAGVRGAACVGGRSGRVSHTLVRTLVECARAQNEDAARSASRRSAVTT